MAVSIFKNRQNDDKEMSFIDHLEELRWHIVRSLIAVLITAVFLFIYMGWFLDCIMLGPSRRELISYTGLCDFSQWIGAGDALCLPPVKVELQAAKFGSQFIASMTLAFTRGFVVAFTYVFWEFWRF